jgi:hypothetical protein
MMNLVLSFDGSFLAHGTVPPSYIVHPRLGNRNNHFLKNAPSVDSLSTFYRVHNHAMNPQAEIAPFFSTGADPVLLKDAQDILRSLRRGVNVWNGQQRQALAGISALLACER